MLEKVTIDIDDPPLDSGSGQKGVRSETESMITVDINACPWFLLARSSPRGYG